MKKSENKKNAWQKIFVIFFFPPLSFNILSLFYIISLSIHVFKTTINYYIKYANLTRYK